MVGGLRFDETIEFVLDDGARRVLAASLVGRHARDERLAQGLAGRLQFHDEMRAFLRCRRLVGRIAVFRRSSCLGLGLRLAPDRLFGFGCRLLTVLFREIALLEVPTL